MTTTRVTREIGAPRSAVYRALLDAEAVAHWMVPNGMTSEVHEFDAREGGVFRIADLRRPNLSRQDGRRH